MYGDPLCPWFDLGFGRKYENARMKANQDTKGRREQPASQPAGSLPAQTRLV